MVKDIPEDIDFGVKWKGKYLRPSKHAVYELISLGYDLYDILKILEEGYDCRKGKRAKKTYEKCIKKGRKIMNLSLELKRALTKEETFFTVTDKKHFADPRWKEATNLASVAKYPECQRLVANIDRDYGRRY